MTNDDIKSLIAQSVRQTVAQSGLPFFRDPLIGYAAATDPLFGKLPEVVGPGHLAPVSLLPAVRTVLAFFCRSAKKSRTGTAGV